MDESSSESSPRTGFGISGGEPSVSVMYTQQITHFTLPAFSVTRRLLMTLALLLSGV
jgi:hypothetical protein